MFLENICFFITHILSNICGNQKKDNNEKIVLSLAVIVGQYWRCNSKPEGYVLNGTLTVMLKMALSNILLGKINETKQPMILIPPRLKMVKFTVSVQRIPPELI